MRSARMMKILELRIALLLLAVLFALPASAQFSIDWFTFDGGGGTSTGGVYTVSGTIGQPDAGAMSGGSYSLAGGFWGGAAAQYKIYLPVVLRK